MRTSDLMGLAVAAAVVVLGGAAFAAQGGPVDQVPANLTPADVLDAQMQQSQDEAKVSPEDQNDMQEDFRGRGGPGWRPGPGYRGPGYRGPIYPRPYPLPYPGRVIITCYAQSPANGLTYSGTGYYAGEAQTVALNECYSATGYTCVSQGCN